MVPVTVVELDETDATFCKAPCQQAVRSKGPISWNCTVLIQSVLRLIGQINEFRNTHLHAESHFVLCNTGLYLGVCQQFITGTVDAVDGFN